MSFKASTTYSGSGSTAAGTSAVVPTGTTEDDTVLVLLANGQNSSFAATVPTLAFTRGGVAVDPAPVYSTVVGVVNVSNLWICAIKVKGVQAGDVITPQSGNPRVNLGTTLYVFENDLINFGTVSKRASNTNTLTVAAITGHEDGKEAYAVFATRTADPAITFTSLTSGWTSLAAFDPNGTNPGTEFQLAKRDADPGSGNSTGSVTQTVSASSANGEGFQFQEVAPEPEGPGETGNITSTLCTNFADDSLTIGAVIAGGYTDVEATVDGADHAMTVSGGWAYVTVTGLDPDTAYPVTFKVDDVAQTDAEATYRTLPEAGTPASFVAVAGSCHTASSGSAVKGLMLADAPVFLAHMGDMQYDDATSQAAWITAMNASLTNSAMKALLAAVPMSYCWDNHDRIIVDDLNSGTTDPDTLTTWRRLAGDDWPTDAQYWTWVVGRVRFIHTDMWSQRDDPDLVSEPRTMLGATQKAWLKDTLDAATEPVIVWFKSFPNHYVTGGRWNSFNSEVEELETWINARPSVKARLVMIGGDSHDLRADSGTRTGTGNNHNFIGIPDLNASGIGQGSNTPWETGDWDIAEEITGSGNGMYSRITVTDDGDTLVFLWEAVDQDGDVRASYERLYTGGGSDVVAVATVEGGGHKSASGGSAVVAAAGTTGGGYKVITGGSDVAATADTTGAGSKTGTGGAAAAAVASTTGAGTKAAAGGADAVGVGTATGAGTKNVSGGADAVGVAATEGAGTKGTMGGADTVGTADTTGGGVKSTGGGADAEAVASTTGTGSKGSSGGSDAVAVAFTTGGGHPITPGRGGSAAVAVATVEGGGWKFTSGGAPAIGTGAVAGSGVKHTRGGGTAAGVATAPGAGFKIAHGGGDASAVASTTGGGHDGATPPGRPVRGPSAAVVAPSAARTEIVSPTYTTEVLT